MRKNSFVLSNLLIAYWFQISIVEGIIGGYDARPGQFKYAVSVQAFLSEGSSGKKVNRNMCSGVILSDEDILTAAHCVISSTTEFTNLIWSVVVGAIDPKDKDNISVNVAKIIVPSNYEPKRTEISNTTFNRAFSIYSDIALLKLEKKLGLQSHTNRLIAVKLPPLFSTATTYEEKIAIISGFGLNKRVEEVSNTINSNTPLHYADTTIIPNSWCQLISNELIRHDHICGQLNHDQYKTSVSITKGDGGGPLVINGNLLIGILSNTKTSRDGIYNVQIYSKVAYYIPFIQKAMAGKKTHDLRVAIYEFKYTRTGFRKTITEI